MISQKILLLNGVFNGGDTYAEYLKQALISLPLTAHITVYNIRERTMMEAEAVANLLNINVTDINIDDIQHLKKNDFDIIISNESSVGQYIDSSIISTFISHGSAAMPAAGRFMYGDILSYFDIVTAASRATMQMLASGTSSYRACRRRGEIAVNGPAIRSDLRRTSFMPIRPIKQENRHKTPQSAVPSTNFTIGLLPTQAAAIQSGVSMYNNISDIIVMLAQKFTQSQIVFRPYPLDLLSLPIRQYCESLLNTGRIQVDMSNGSSADFYRKCDLIITDGSTGGISFMLRKTVPPIYFVPNAALENDVTRWFVQNMCERAPVTHDLASLEEAIRRITNSSPDDLFSYYSNYCDFELFFEKDQSRYFTDIVNGDTNVKNAVHVDPFGAMDSTLMEAMT